MAEAWPLLASASWRAPQLAAAVTADRIRWSAAFGAALLAHAAVLYALLREPVDPMAGSGGQQVDTISVTIVSSSLLESRDLDRPQPSAPAAAATVETTDGAPDSSPAAATEQHQEKEKKDQEKEKKKPAEEPVRAVEAITEAPVEVQREQRQQAAAPAQGGAASRSEAASEDKASAAAAAASAGAIREYARYVAQALARTKPRGAGGLGTVRIKFVIDAEGALASAEIARTSGSPKLDDQALEAVRRTRFPLPPRGMTLTQLTYEVPYHFR
jgi:TonB family protein